MKSLTQQLDFLRRHNVHTMGHSNNTLLAHLSGVRALLVRWENPPDVLAAGLYHSVYGTESFRQTALPRNLRSTVRAVIGERAEMLAYVFGAMEKTTFDASVSRGADFCITDRHTGEKISLSAPQWAALCEVVVANWLEQRPRVAPEKRRLKTEMFRTMRRWLSPGAAAALSTAYGFENGQSDDLGRSAEIQN